MHAPGTDEQNAVKVAWCIGYLQFMSRFRGNIISSVSTKCLFMLNKIEG
jgi:hypothetical protein